VSRDWRQSWLMWSAALVSAGFLALWWGVDDSFLWGFVVFAFLTAIAWMRETNDWPRSPLAWVVWLSSIMFLVLWIAVDENFRWPCWVFLFLAIAMRAREARPARGESGDQSLRSH
jgi:hypothetical protein